MPTSDEPAAIARRLLRANMYMTLATADAAGSPWASPVWFAALTDTELLWVSSPETRHSRNIAVRPEIAIVIFDSTVPVGGAEALYLEATAGELSGAELERAITGYSARSVACGALAWEVADVLPPSTVRLYRATATSRSVLIKGQGDRRLPVGPVEDPR